MKVFVAQLDPTIGDFSGNKQKILMSIDRARKEGADIVVCPEMAICGYPPEDLVYHETFVQTSEKTLQEIAPETKGLMVVIGLVRKNTTSGEKPLFNSAAILQNGKVVGFHDKWLLPTYDVFDERRYFEPGKMLKVWEWKGKTVAVLICEDIWQHAGYVGYTQYPCDPVADLLHLKPDLLININASPYAYEKPALRLKVCQKTTKTLKCPLIFCCQVGGNDELVFDGYSMCVNGSSELAHLAKGFVEDGMLVDTEKLPATPAKFDHLQDLYQALVLGTRDYFYKQGFKKAVIGLSGGIDSALVACVAVDALGKENVYGVGMPSRFSSKGSVTDAEVLAKNLGIAFDLISIEQVFKDYLKVLEPHFQKKPFDTTEENLQARIRGMLLMALSNKHGYLVLSTGNKSEMAMGYCTLYGDMAGGLAVIADVTKVQVFALSRWINRHRGLIPKETIEKPPSAELKPDQKDIDTLPPYEQLDAVIHDYVEDFLSAEEIAKKRSLSLELVTDVIKRIHRAEYKRRQAPPAIRVSKKAFRVGRRYPIVQGWIR
ncbi:MAG: NAD+ synthase [Verrucomicrobia bacterium]|nr:NAD+ synthase [Verrucomicrobiota bacterium]